jgi:hypothetical protein
VRQHARGRFAADARMQSGAANENHISNVNELDDATARYPMGA